MIDVETNKYMSKSDCKMEIGVPHEQDDYLKSFWVNKLMIATADRGWWMYLYIMDGLNTKMETIIILFTKPN